MIRNDNYCLQRNEFEGNVKIYWQKFQTDNDFCDVTLVCEDKQIKPHKLIIEVAEDLSIRQHWNCWRFKY